MTNFSFWWRAARRFAGILFVGAGLFKVVAHAPFADYLHELRVPLPQFFAASVAVLEISGGIALLFWPRGKSKAKIARVLAALLCFDMLAALFLVGVPGRAGKTHAAGGHQIGGEAWRAPLEIALLMIALGCVFSRDETKNRDEDNA